MTLYMYILLLQVHSVSLKTAGERVRISLKSMESLTYMCTDVNMLLDLNTKLNDLIQDFKSGLPQEEQLVVQPAIISRALGTKRKYARIRSSLFCSKLPKPKPKGRRKTDSKTRNRVRAKADRLRKVNKFTYW